MQSEFQPTTTILTSTLHPNFQLIPDVRSQWLHLASTHTTSSGIVWHRPVPGIDWIKDAVSVPPTADEHSQSLVGSTAKAKNRSQLYRISATNHKAGIRVTVMFSTVN
ncbi:hypothetical protein ElyMa_002029100 [Elysia marginata]|uniref:Uncharacterized protein n=1 Tax=Elysia marginata TaxID=1093978 RepID=A0AAV4F6Z3_9GAST|nr:hypothetical protein ElyMa_002029100 [Elysia marginata]